MGRQTRAERSLRAILFAGLGIAVACGGGGGGPAGPDVTPPAVPVSSKISVDPPIPSSLVRLTGSAGAVENNATVQLANSSAEQRTGEPVTASATAASDGAFTVSVPAQLGDQLRVTATDAAGNVSGPLSLKAGPTPTTITVVDPGDDHLLTLISGEGAFNLPFTGGSERYTLVVQSLNPTSGSFPISVSGSQQVAVRSLRAAARPAVGGETLEAELRAAERQAMAGLSRPTLPSPPRGLAPSDDPPVGSTRTFNVVNRISGYSLTARGDFDIVTARLLYKGDHTLIYVDERVPGQNVPDAMIQTVGDRFDQQTYHVDREAFGNESDIDGNNRVIVLLTPTVNALNTEETIEDGILTGFFFAIDLVDIPIGNPFGNDGEIFYTLAPDPDREFGAATVPIDGLRESLHAILAHEFEHMINAAARIENLSLEEVWLDEGLAHYAETLNDVDEGDIQNVLRAGLYLQEPHAWSLTGDEGASLEQRGAAWLLLLYLADQEGPGLIRELVQSGLVGTHNIEVSADTSFSFLFHLFSSALFLDGQGITGDSAFEFTSVDIRDVFQAAKASFAMFSPPRFLGPFLDLRTASVPGGNLSSINVKGGSAAYFDVSSNQAAATPILVRADRQSNLQVTIIRTQ
jgi:hypothetical protein